MSKNHYYGSIKNKIVASDLWKERDKIQFDKNELRIYLIGGPVLSETKDYYRKVFMDNID